ncbi:uncharacterized protein N7458_011802 [Penicillium daleae]|uniref:Uncharacterized protein n=1 Tax=Penicillium daleae TaxID=63821 RepID=A0AAD6FW32_9EURO|nr:uncharacterized protein N7458_011802 [Penicillium daleae]KAJ5432646.1 hypothetical protein N7458_011802 [Penicillium daleae]
MASAPLRSGAPLLRLRNLQSTRVARIITPPRALYSILSRNTRQHPNANPTKTLTPLHTTPTRSQPPTPLIRAYSSPTPPKPTADLLIEELQDLYEIAKDEFEIATESTDGATIYAASDRDSARDALNQLCAVYHLYTARPGEDVDSGVRNVGGQVEGGGEAGSELGEDAFVETHFNPQEVGGEVRDEVRRRVGQRVRELRNAVEILEERAHAE